MSGPQQRLFFALRPPPAAVAAIHAVAASLRDTRAIAGRWTNADKYHVTLQFLGTHPGVPPPLVAAALQAGAGLVHAPCEVALDRVWHFHGGRQAPCVLLADAASHAALQDLYAALGAALRAHDVSIDQRRDYAPHMTLAYGAMHAAAPVAIEPIRWRAREFTLMLSHVGSGRHEQLARWPLSASTKVEL